MPNKVLRPGQYSPECLFHPSPPVLRHLRKSDATKPLEAQGCPKMCWVQLIILLLLRRPEHRRKTLKMFAVCIVASQQCELPGTTSYFFIQSLTKFKPGISRRRGTFWLMWLCNMTLHVIAQIWPSPAWSITKQFPLHQEKRGFCAQFASGIQPCCVPWWKNGTVQQNVATCLHIFIYNYTASYHVQNIASLTTYRMILEGALQIMCLSCACGSNLVNIRRC